GKRGSKPKGKVKIKWSPNFAYAIGLLVSDGCLSPNGRHVIFVSKEREQINNFLKALSIQVSVGNVYSGYKRKKALRVQFGDVLFYHFLLSIGLTPNKSKTIGKIKLPAKYFFDFLRGSFDGDGSSYSYWDPRWRSSFMFYTEFVSASKIHILWLQEEIRKRLRISGHITGDGKKSSVFQLKYAKSDSLKLLRKMYPRKRALYLERKRLKIERALSIVGERL
ncbi:MAG: hypothetical protein AAB597_03245, partial [Patescibacteria group bacterium]